MDVIYKEENNSKECILLVAEIKERGRVRYGLISSDGQELLKCEYCFENLFFKDDLGKDNENSIKDIANYRFISRDGYEEEEFDRYAHNGISSSNWGVFSLKQKRIIIDGYNCIYRLDNYFVAGRNGHFLKEGHDGGHIEGYSGVYDLFSLEGELLIGGFSAIQTVGSWIILTYDVAWEEDDDYNYCTFRKVFHSATKWLIIDSDLHLLSSELLGSSSSIELGTIISISETKGEKGVRIHKYNYPTRLFFNKEPLVYNKYFIVSINNTNYFLSTNSVAISKGYAQIQLLGNSLYFTTDSGDKTSTIGVFDADHFCSIVEGCLAITKPVGVFFFSIHKLENGYCRVTLHNISSSTSTTVIEQISVIGLRELLNNSKLLIINESNQKLEEGIAVLDSSVFDKGVETKFRRTDSFVAKSTEYWISIDPNLCFVPAEEEQKEDDECYPDSSDNLITAYDNPYYDEGLDMDQQSDSFWEEF